MPRWWILSKTAYRRQDLIFSGGLEHDRVTGHVRLDIAATRHVAQVAAPQFIEARLPATVMTWEQMTLFIYNMAIERRCPRYYFILRVTSAPPRDASMKYDLMVASLSASHWLPDRQDALDEVYSHKEAVSAISDDIYTRYI